MGEETAVVEQPTVEEKLVVDRHQMVTVYQMAGFLTADNWTNEELMRRSVQFTEEDLSRMKTEEAREMLDRILSANERKEVFEVVGDKFSKPISKNEEDGTMSDTATVEKVKKDKAPKVKKDKVPKESKVDQFGCHQGSIPFRINAALSAKARTVASIAEETGIDEKRVGSHFSYWLKKGTGLGKVLEEVDGKYRLNMDK